jgi:flagellar basal body-associated protein FliL
MFIPLIKYIPIFAVVIMVAFLAIFIKHARDGKYSIAQENKLAIFISLGEWIMILFEVNKETVA